MKLKYFMRGLGAGIIFTAVIMMAAYVTSGGYKLTDEEVIRRAEKLGMVMEESQAATAGDADKKQEKRTTEGTAEEKTTENTDGGTTENSTTEGDTDTTESTTAEDGTKPAVTEEGDYITAKITVSSGMSSTEVAEMLQASGIIEDAGDFDGYLNQNGFSTKIEVGTYEFNSGMDYAALAKELTKGN